MRICFHSAVSGPASGQSPRAQEPQKSGGPAVCRVSHDVTGRHAVGPARRQRGRAAAAGEQMLQHSQTLQIRRAASTAQPRWAGISLNTICQHLKRGLRIAYLWA
jgi:hypothetical protein